MFLKKSYIPEHGHYERRLYALVLQPLQARLCQRVTYALSPPGLVYNKTVEISNVATLANGRTTNELAPT